MVKRSFLLKLEKTLHVQYLLQRGTRCWDRRYCSWQRKGQRLGGDENLGERVSLGKKERPASSESRGKGSSMKEEQRKEGSLRKRRGEKGLTHEGCHVLCEFGESKTILVLDFLFYSCISGAQMDAVASQAA